MTIPWWYRANAKKALESWIRPLITPRPYSLRYEIGEGSYMNFSKREIVIDPTSFPFLAKVLPITWQGKRIDTEAKLQWRIARMAARHEAMHTLFSVPFGCGGTLHYLVNALEDEWMEELAQVFYPKAWGDFVMFARLLAQYYPLPDPAKTARSSFFLSMCLYHRWDWKRPRGTPSRIRFHTPEDEQFWQKEIRPLVEKAWKTNVFEQRKDIARDILRLLSIPESAPLPRHGILLPESSFDIKGERSTEDTPISVGDESSGISSSKGGSDAHSDEPPHTGVVSVESDDDEVPLPLEAAEELYLLPSEYLENQVRGEKGRLLRGLMVKTPDTTEDAVPYGGEFDVEANLRSDGARPFILRDTPAPAPEGLAIALLIDATGSMGGDGTGGLDERGVFVPSFYDPRHRMTYARQVAMLFELVCPNAGITLLIGAAGDDGYLEHLPDMPRRRKPYQPITWLRTRQTPRDSEVTRAAIAGLYGNYNRECISKSLLEAQRKLAEVSAGTRLIIYIHDGIPTDEDPDDIVRVLKGIRRKGTLVVAPYVGPQSDIGNLQAIFGPEWTLGIAKLPDLSKRLGRLLLKYAQH